MARRYSSVWQPKHYSKKKLLQPVQVGDKFHRLTVIEIRLKKGFGNTREIVCRCECGRIVTTSAQSLRKCFITACPADMVLEKRYAKEIELAKQLERLTRPRIDPAELPKREPWSWAGDEDALAEENQDAK
jgi:hypothetical protein